ncbi:hypothetical protein [Streptomyces sp. NPDC057257]
MKALHGRLRGLPLKTTRVMAAGQRRFSATAFTDTIEDAARTTAGQRTAQ